MRWIYGRHPVEEALRAGRPAREIWLQHQSREPWVRDLVGLARKAGATVKWVSRGELDRLANGVAHQGLALKTSETPGADFRSLLHQKPASLLVALDEIQDPHNFGAIARSAACLGAKGVLIPERRSAPVTQTVVQSSAGAIEKIDVYQVTNLANALMELKEKGYWIYGAEMSGKPAWDVTFNEPMVLVIGSEGHGLRRLIKERCDELVRVPQAADGVQSLNASCAASVLLYEIARGRRKEA